MEPYDPSKETISQFLSRKNDSDEKETEEETEEGVEKVKNLIINDGKIDYDAEDAKKYDR